MPTMIFSVQMKQGWFLEFYLIKLFYIIKYTVQEKFENNV